MLWDVEHFFFLCPYFWVIKVCKRDSLQIPFSGLRKLAVWWLVMIRGLLQTFICQMTGDDMLLLILMCLVLICCPSHCSCFRSHLLLV